MRLPPGLLSLTVIAPRLRWTPSVGQESGRLKREPHRVPFPLPIEGIIYDEVYLFYYIDQYLSVAVVHVIMGVTPRVIHMITY